MSDYTFKVNLVAKGEPAKQELISALNPNQAKRLAEARYPGFTATSANQTY